MDPEDALAKKRENLEKLIRNMDEAIHRELLRYEEAEFYIRLQSECFNLYPVVVEALSLQITDDKRRAIFCSIVKGRNLERLATYHNLTPQEAVQEFRSTVRELRRRVNEGAFTAKESVNILLLHERNELKDRVRSCDAMCKKLQQTNTHLFEQFATLLDDKEKHAENGETDSPEEEQAINEHALREEIRKELLDEMEKQAEEQAAKTSKHVSIVSRWIHQFILRWR